jgi:DNA-3-methyladenine glycosylase
MSALREILSQNALEAAPRLLGSYLCRGELKARIVEVEAYRGSDDPGSHAYKGLTPRNKAMFGPPGFAYVYFTYGVHWMLNVVVEAEGMPAALLIRAAQPITGIDQMFARRPKAKVSSDLLSGPAKLAAAFGVYGRDYGMDMLDINAPMFLEKGEAIAKVVTGPRIGLAKGKGDQFPWRFMDGLSNDWISKR